MSRQYVTLAEANSMLPLVRDRLFIVAQLHLQVQGFLEELEELGFEPNEDSFDVRLDGAPIEVTIARATLQALLDSMQAELEKLAVLGCIVKDVDTGTVGWYAKNERWGEVFLSWRAGEESVAHWHEVNTGQIRRRGIDELENAELDIAGLDFSGSSAADLKSAESGFLRRGEGR